MIKCSFAQTMCSVIIPLWNATVSQCWDFGYLDNHVTMWLMLLEEMIPGCGWLPAVIMQPHQNHEVLMPGRALAVGRITASKLFLTARPCDATTPITNRSSTVTDSWLRHSGFKANVLTHIMWNTWSSSNLCSYAHTNTTQCQHIQYFIRTCTHTYTQQA